MGAAAAAVIDIGVRRQFGRRSVVARFGLGLGERIALEEYAFSVLPLGGKAGEGV